MRVLRVYIVVSLWVCCCIWVRCWLLPSAVMDALRAPIGRPPARVSHGKTVHWTVLPPILRFACAGISLPAGSDNGRCPLNPARAARPLTLARALPKSTSKVWRFRPSIASICHKRHMVELYRGSKVNYEGNALRDGILLTSDLQSLRRHLQP